MPGLDKSRVVGTSDQDLDEFTCAICLALFVSPEVTQCCRQTYCKDCISEWVSQHKTCPNDRKTLTKRGLRPVPRAMTNFLDNIKIKCDYEWDGCMQVVRIGDLCQHRIVCDFRPNQLCKTCGLHKEGVMSHNCIESLKLEKEKTNTKYLNLLDEKALLLNERQENIEIISALKTELADIRNNQQMIINRIKNEQLRALDELEESHNRLLQMEWKTNQKNLESVKHSLKNLQKELTEAKINHQITIDRIKKEQSTALDQLAKKYDRESKKEKENHQIALRCVKKHSKRRR